MIRILSMVVCLLVSPFSLIAQKLVVHSEFQRTDPFGQIVEADQIKEGTLPGRGNNSATIELKGTRAGYVSFQLAVQPPKGGDYSLNCDFARAGPNVQADLFKAWFHHMQKGGQYIPDALIPVQNPYSGKLPDPENQIKDQTSQAFWVDLYITREAKPGRYEGCIKLQSGREHSIVKVQLEVLNAIVPDEDAIVVDHNSYGTEWLAQLYPKLSQSSGRDFYSSDAFFNLIHAYHRLFYEHRGAYHQLGYGHAGKVGPEFAPQLSGTGRSKHVASWDLFDRHYAPLLDGSAFAKTRRGPRPIPFAYLTINPEWPASFLWWGEPGYEAEFTQVVGEMEKHFREKGWTGTRFEVFFNHKKRYKGFPWDGDESKFPKDDAFFREYGRLLKKAIPMDSPVKFVFRSDVSWRMEDQFKSLAGVVNFWVCGKSILSWLPESVKQIRQRGDIVWIYSGPPAISESASAILQNPLQAWVWGVDGYVHWQTVDPSPDPWFNSDGEMVCLAYPGDRFGVEEPIPSIRLKIQRNLIQDLNLLEQIGKRHSADWVRSQVTERINGTQPAAWWTPRPAGASLPPEEWTNYSPEGEVDPALQRFLKRPPDFWIEVRSFIFDQLEGGTQ
ncbi:MAG TPA: hypothetical protein VMW38_19825 [Terriglobia bacterium]|nr:hypothetical protein [Terriglobia bacterium]